MGRNMFGGSPGPWDESWKGWWGDNPPFHHPVFVLTSHPREPLEMQGGTTFHFVTHESSRRSNRRAAAGEKEVSLGGGASVAQQYLAAGLLDEIVVSLVPILLGGGTSAIRKRWRCEARAGRVGRGARGDSHQIRAGIARCWRAGRTRSACAPNRSTSLKRRMRFAVTPWNVTAAEPSGREESVTP
jgi:RibD C-terminal domain